jgi:hypothetical protein
MFKNNLSLFCGCILLLTACLPKATVKVSNQEYISKGKETHLPVASELMEGVQKQLVSVFADSNLRPLFLSDFTNLILSSKSPTKTFENIALQLKENPKAFPLIPELLFDFEMKSSFDQHSFLVKIEMPATLPKDPSLMLVLDNYYSYPNPFENLPCIKVYFPSRPNMNYQLISQRDYKELMASLKKLVPSLEKAPLFLVGWKQSTQGALSLANQFPRDFSGVAVSGMTNQLNYKNLDTVPIICFSSISSLEEQQWMHAFIERLKARGNNKCLLSKDALQPTLKKLLTLQPFPSVLPKTHLNSYQQAKVTSWLTITQKQFEVDNASIEANLKASTLNIESENIASISIDTKKLKKLIPNLETVSFNNTLYDLSNTPKIWNIPESTKLSNYAKHKIPSTFLSFYTQEPLQIVYQDNHSSPQFIEKAKDLALRLSKGEFLGTPIFNLKIQSSSLSSYIKNPPKHPHRLIAIGQNKSLEALFSETFPILFEEDIVSIKEVPQLWSSTLKDTAYSLIYPINPSSSLQLALLLVAEDNEGLESLDNFYNQATALLDPYDVRVWIKDSEGFYPISQGCFDSNWEQLSSSESFINIPSLSTEFWNEHLQNLILEKTQHTALIEASSPITSLQVPSKLTHKQLPLYLPERHFVSLKPFDLQQRNVINYLLKSFPDSLSIVGLDPYLIHNKSSGMFQLSNEINYSKNISIALDLNLWNKVPQSIKESVELHLIPVSLHEITLKTLKQSPLEFAQDLLHTRYDNEDIAQQ